MINEIKDSMKSRMDKVIANLNSNLLTVKVGRANPSMLDRIEVEYYGSMTPLNQVANISTPEARVLLIQPWEKSMIKEIEKAILKSDLGLTPNNDGTSVRLIIPELTEETRKNTVKLVKKMAMKYYPSENLVDEEIASSGKAVQMFEIEVEHMSGKEIQEI